MVWHTATRITRSGHKRYASSKLGLSCGEIGSNPEKLSDEALGNPAVIRYFLSTSYTDPIHILRVPNKT